MTFRTGLTGLALAGTAFLWASTALSQPVAGPPTAAATAFPLPIDPDAGLEAREAAAPVAEANPGTLNAQYAALQTGPALAVSEAEPPTPAAPPVQLVAAVAPVASPAPAAPSVALSRRVVESAAAFVDYMQRAAAVKPQWVDASGVARGLEQGGVYEQGEIDEGEVAYAAMVALQDPRFVDTLQGAAVDPMQRVSLAHALLSDPGVVLQTPGARSAAIRAASALGRLGYGLQVSGEAVKRSAYDMQHAAWSLTQVAEPQAALLRLKARSAEREPLGADGGRTLIAFLAADPGAGGEVRRVTPVVARGLTLAALAVLGEAGEDRGTTLLPILAEASNAQCVKMARLNLYQCLSVAGPQYEDVFCLGEHAMMETARCVEAASGWSPPAPVLSTTEPVAAAASAAPVAASIYIPVAFTSTPPAPAAASYTMASAGMVGQR